MSLALSSEQRFLLSHTKIATFLPDSTASSDNLTSSSLSKAVDPVNPCWPFEAEGGMQVEETRKMKAAKQEADAAFDQQAVASDTRMVAE